MRCMKIPIRKNIDIALFKNVISLIGVQGCNYLIPLMILPYLVRVLEPYGYGVLSFSLAIIQYFLLLTDYGFNLSATQKISTNRMDKQKISTIFWNVQCCKLLLMLFGVITLYIMSFLSQDINNNFKIFIYSYGMVVGAVLFPTWLFQGKEEMQSMAIINISTRLLSIPLMLIFVKNTNDIWIAASIYSFTSILSGVVGLIYIYKKRWIDFCFPRKKYILMEFRDGWHLFISSMSITLYTTSTTIILGLFLGPVAVGFFVAADKLRLAVQGLINPISQAIYPKINSEMGRSKEKAYSIIKKLLTYQSLFTFIISVMLFLNANFLVDIIYGKDYQLSISILKVLSFVPFLVGVSNVLGIQTMIVMGFKKQFSYIIIMSGIMNIIIIFPLLNYYGTIGASISVLLTEFVVTLLMFIFVYRKKIPIF